MAEWPARFAQQRQHLSIRRTPLSEELRKQAVDIYNNGLAHITPEALLRNALSLDGDTLVLNFLEGEQRVPLPKNGTIRLFSVGKAAAPLAMKAHQILGELVSEGLVVTKTGFGLEGMPYLQIEAAHPVPDANGEQAAKAAAELAKRTGEEDILLVLVSGGASALLPSPLPGVSLADKQALAEQMLRTEMDIHQINHVRKAISQLKGGGLASLAANATVVGMYLSDVPGDDMASIGSGPTIPEAVNSKSVIGLLQEKGLWETTPEAIRKILEDGSAEAAKKPPAKTPINGLIGTNRHLLYAMADAAREMGYLTWVEEASTTGLNAEALPRLLGEWEDFSRQHRDVAVCRISGGETLVEVRGSGMGGRCQELAALMLPKLAEEDVFLAAGSDGNDGPTDAAGGVVDRESWEKINALKIPYADLLKDNDSYHLLERSGNLIKVPPTRNNVSDVHLFIRA